MKCEKSRLNTHRGHSWPLVVPGGGSRGHGAVPNGGPAGSPAAGLIYEGARRVVERDNKGVGVMIFPDAVLKYTSSMAGHIPAVVEGTQA